MDAGQYRAASLVAQAVMSGFVPSLVVDGKWGSFSQATYDGLRPSQRDIVDGALRGAGLPSASALAEHRRKVKAAGKASRDPGIVNIVLAAADEFGIPRELMLATVETESAFNPNATNGSSRGLGQMQPAAWEDALKLAPDIGAYANWSDPRSNARATAAYLKLKTLELGRRLGKKNIRVEPWMIYLAHQQGTAGFAQLMELAADKRPAVTPQQVERMRNNPPQDGAGATSDPSEFIRRWKSVVERRIARHV